MGAQNLVLYSEDITNAAWEKKFISVSTQGDGSELITESASYSLLKQIVADATPTIKTYIMRVEAKAGSASQMSFGPESGETAFATVGLTDEWAWYEVARASATWWGKVYAVIKVGTNADNAGSIQVRKIQMCVDTVKDYITTTNAQIFDYTPPTPDHVLSFGLIRNPIRSVVRECVSEVLQ